MSTRADGAKLPDADHWPALTSARRLLQKRVLPDRGALPQLDHRSLRDEPPVVQKQQAIAEAIGHVEKMGREQNRRALLVSQRSEQRAHLRRRGRIEGVGRLVEKQDARGVD